MARPRQLSAVKALVVVTASVAVLGITAAHAVSPADKCQAAKIKAAGKKTYDKVKCRAKALQKGVPLDSLCLTKAEDKFMGAITKADTFGSCAGTATALGAAVDEFVVNCEALLAIPTAPVVDTYRAAKIKATGKDAYAKAKCNETAFKKGVAVDPLCLTKAEHKFTVAMTKADPLGVRPGTPAALAAAVDQGVSAYVAQLTCPSGQSVCSGVCIDTTTDPQHCGACGTSCPFGAPVCSGGACTCPSTYSNCHGVCVDTSSDPSFCGGCVALLCPRGATCSAGVCTCAGLGQAVCGIPLQCVNLLSDRNNCGSCGHVCTGDTYCYGGVCACDPFSDTTLCGDSCVNLQTDAANCGSCGHSCGEFIGCGHGTCKPECGGQLVCSAGSICCWPGDPVCDYGLCYPLVPDGGSCFYSRDCASDFCCVVPFGELATCEPGGCPSGTVRRD